MIRACSETLKRVTLELGGNDPAIVCANVDPVTVASKIALFAFCNSGQMCMSIKRVYVHESVYDQVLDTVVQYVKALELGVDEKSFVGPISNNNHFEYVKGLLANIEKNQLTIATGGTKLLADGKGFLLPPTIINNPPDNSQIVSQEQFG